MINAQGTRPAFISYSLAFRKEFMGHHASIAATATNFVQEYVNQEYKLQRDNFSMNSGRQIPYRSFGVNLMYKFRDLNKQKGSEDMNFPGPPEN